MVPTPSSMQLQKYEPTEPQTQVEALHTTFLMHLQMNMTLLKKFENDSLYLELLIVNVPKHLSFIPCYEAHCEDQSNAPTQRKAHACAQAIRP